MQQLAAVRGGDPALTEQEQAVLERLFEIVGSVTDEDVSAWIARVAICAKPQLDVCEPIDRLAAVAIARLTLVDREVLRLLIERHPHTYFDGFHEQAHLQRAYDLVVHANDERS